MSNQPRQIILIGYRGSGKSTVGKLLAQRFGYQFADADVILENTAGKTIRQIFATEGEAAFRDHEEQILRMMTPLPHTILATGGGVILREANRLRLKQYGFVIWLSAPAEVLYARMQADTTTAERRPNLSGGGLAEVQAMLEIRTPIYRQLADLEIPVGEVSPEVAVDRILAEWIARGMGQHDPVTST